MFATRAGGDRGPVKRINVYWREDAFAALENR
jgi:hypothetical protein